jgi:hypothetical protein
MSNLSNTHKEKHHMATEKKSVVTMKKTNLAHIFLVDWDESGLLKEMAILKEDDDGTLYGIDIDVLHTIDKARLKKIVTSVHADKYPLWELLSQATLSNGMNALDFFHYNAVKIKRPKGTRASSSSIANVRAATDDKMIGSEFANPQEASLDAATRSFTR